MNTLEEMIAAVKEIANDRYEESFGWSEIVECYTDEELGEPLIGLGIQTNKEAIEYFEKIANLRTELCEDAQAEIF